MLDGAEFASRDDTWATLSLQGGGVRRCKAFWREKSRMSETV
ncbi:hypothetical protein TIFTF001_017830 [Ficus carica]|uniref:Uncharacterized protein n=1 Tax=Ficus carica TaxID=3494 RepID=A0AA88A5T7_FICCA|nr:hypothetical protein TIFTF001_017830 [Ficus carica]